MQGRFHSFSFSRFGKVTLSLLPVAVGLIAFAFSKGMYQSMDEIDMRSLIEGTAGDGSVPGTPFCVYMNVIYGYILRFFYGLLPGVYWYDLFTYVLNGLAVAAITYLLQTESIRRNIMSVCVMSGIAAYYFAMPQFTLTAGLSAIACTLSIISLARAERTFPIWVLCSLAIFFGAFSALIRFHCFLVVCAFVGLLFVLCAKLIWRRFLTKSLFLGAVVLSLGITLQLVGRQVVQQNAQWNDLSKFYQARSELVDNTGVWEDGWQNLAPLADELTASEGFDTAEYRCVLTFFTLGRKGLLDGAQLQHAANKICKYVAENQPFRLKMRISEVMRFFWILTFIALFIVCIYNRSFGWRFVCVPITFVCINVLISTFIHYVPFRVWWNFAAACFIAVLLLAPTGVRLFDFHRWPILTQSLPLAALSAMLLSVTPYIRYQRFQYASFAEPYQRTKLPPGNLYLMDWCTESMLAAAFQEDPNKGRGLILLGLTRFPHYDKLLEKWNVSQSTTLEDVCDHKKRVQFVFLNKNGRNHTLKGICRTIAFCLGRRTGMRVAAYGTDLGNGVSLLQLKSLRPGETDPAGVLVDEEFQISQVLDKMHAANQPSAKM